MHRGSRYAFEHCSWDVLFGKGGFILACYGHFAITIRRVTYAKMTNLVRCNKHQVLSYFFFRKAWLSSFSFPQCSWLIFLPSNPLSNERKILLLHGIVLPGVPGPPTNLWGERKTASLYLQEQKQLLLFESQFISQSVGWKLELKSNFIDIEIKASVCCYFPRPHRSLNDEAPLLHHNLNRAAQLSLR